MKPRPYIIIPEAQPGTRPLASGMDWDAYGCPFESGDYETSMFHMERLFANGFHAKLYKVVKEYPYVLEIKAIATTRIRPSKAIASRHGAGSCVNT